MIRLEESGVKSSGGKCGRSEQSENIKRENKSVVRRSERIARKVV